MFSVSKTVVYRDGYRHCFVVSHFPDDTKGIIVATKITLCVTKRCKIQFGKCADKYDVVIRHRFRLFVGVGGSGKCDHLSSCLTECIKIFCKRENHFGKVIFLLHTDWRKPIDSVIIDNVALLIKSVVEFLNFIYGAKYRVEVTQER